MSLDHITLHSISPFSSLLSNPSTIVNITTNSNVLQHNEIGYECVYIGGSSPATFSSNTFTCVINKPQSLISTQLDVQIVLRTNTFNSSLNITNTPQPFFYFGKLFKTNVWWSNYSYHMCTTITITTCVQQNRDIFNEVGTSTSNTIFKCQYQLHIHIEFHNVVQCNESQMFISNQSIIFPTFITHYQSSKYSCFMFIEQQTIISRKHWFHTCHSCCNDFQHIIHCDLCQQLHNCSLSR